MIHGLFPAAESWWHWMAAVSIQATLLALIVGVLDGLLRRWVWPQLLTALWLVVFCKLLVPPVLTSSIPISELRPDRILIEAVPNARAGNGLICLGFLIWFAGFVLLSGYAVVRYIQLRREWLADQVPAPACTLNLAADVANCLGLSQPPLVLVNPRIHGPAVIGFWRPMVVLPTALVESATRVQLEHVLLHEFAHIRRGDPLMSLACLVVHLTYWFHPMVWLAHCRLATLREVCCDQTVAHVLGGRTKEYRRTLLQLARPLLEKPALGGLGFMHRYSQLMARLTWLERSFTPPCWLRRLTSSVVLAFLLAWCVPLARPGLALETPEPVATSSATSQELPGCLPLRFAVLGMLVQQQEELANSESESSFRLREVYE